MNSHRRGIVPETAGKLVLAVSRVNVFQSLAIRIGVLLITADFRRTFNGFNQLPIFVTLIRRVHAVGTL